MKIRLEKGTKARIELIPLIDVMFLLLVFFIYAMFSMAVHRGLPVTLPESTAAPIEKKNLVLSVTARGDGSLFVDKAPVKGGSLAEVLRDRARGDADAGVLLFADKDLSFQDLYRVLDQIRMAGLSRISLQAEADGSR